MRVRAVLLAAALVLAPLGARAADLVVWWDAGVNPEEAAAIRETAAIRGPTLTFRIRLRPIICFIPRSTFARRRGMCCVLSRTRDFTAMKPAPRRRPQGR